MDTDKLLRCLEEKELEYYTTSAALKKLRKEIDSLRIVIELFKKENEVPYSWADEMDSDIESPAGSNTETVLPATIESPAGSNTETVLPATIESPAGSNTETVLPLSLIHI
jgi:hypothetical protein